jgi:hypothetical protein
MATWRVPDKKIGDSIHCEKLRWHKGDMCVFYLSRAHEILCRDHELLSRGHEIVKSWE